MTNLLQNRRNKKLVFLEKLGEGKIKMTTGDEIMRPKPGDPLALYWVLGTIDAARGMKYDECYFSGERGRLWQRGYQAYIDERRGLKMGKEKQK